MAPGGARSFAVFGPIPANAGAACVADCQRASGTYCDMGFLTYGYCIPRPTCSMSYSASVVPPNGTTILSVTSQGTTPGSFSLLYGTKNGVWDELGSPYNLTSGSFPIVNSPGLAGYYMRYAVMRGPRNEFLCQTSPTYSYFQP